MITQKNLLQTIRCNRKSWGNALASSGRAFHIPIDRMVSEMEEDGNAEEPFSKVIKSFSSFSNRTTTPSLPFPNVHLGLKPFSTNGISLKYFSTYNSENFRKAKDESKKKVSGSSVKPADSSDSQDPMTKKERIQNVAKKGRSVVKKGAISIKDLFQTYGWTFVGTYLGVYFVTLGTLFAGLDSGLIDPLTITNIEFPWNSTGVEDSADKKDFDNAVQFVASYMKKFPWTAPYADVALKNPHMSNLAIAWVATKFTEPIRLPASIAIVRQVIQNKNEKEE